MEGPNLTEERLRYRLDANQAMRERMCLALLPLLGPYTREQPRRPKGGPDGGRDIEAVYEGKTTIWGAVGFKNGGGVDNEARNYAEGKFRDDLDRALAENASLAGFVFFTNVDLTPAIKEKLLAYAQEKGVAFVDIFDIERLRHVLDSPEGLIARLQYLDISMSNTEQAALVGKFGNQLQQAVTARFDRVEQTLAQMDRFLQFQKPILRVDLFIELTEPATSEVLGDEAILFRVFGIHDLDRATSFLCRNLSSHEQAGSRLVSATEFWLDSNPSNVLKLRPSVAPSNNVMASYNELSMTMAGNRIRIADLTLIGFAAVCTQGIRSRIKRVAFDANGYELFNHVPDGRSEVGPPKLPDQVSFGASDRKWADLVTLTEHNLLLNPPKPSSRYAPITRV